MMIVKEGKVEIEAGEGEVISSKIVPFYNPKKKFDRDKTIEILKKFVRGKKELLMCDLLSASGIRALRFASELSNVSEVYAVEHNPKSVEFILRNILRNKKILKADIKVLKSKACRALYTLEKRFDFIDIDPFGTPVDFLKASIAHLRERNAMLAVTATDSGALVGSYPKACLRKYGSKVTKLPFFKEVGLRVLAKKVIEVGAESDIALTPVYAYCRDDYFRIFFESYNGAEKIDNLLKEFGYYENGKVGPAYMGNLYSDKYIDSWLRKEAKINVPYYVHIPTMYKKMKKTIPKMEKIMSDYKKKGYLVSRTHFDPESIKIVKDPH